MKIFGIKITDDRLEKLDEVMQDHKDICAQASEIIEKFGRKATTFLKELHRADNR